MPSDNVIKLKPTRPCPICGKPSSQAFHPFCSGRCQDIDLNRWLSGAYVIPTTEEPGADGSPETELDRPDDADD